MDTTTALLLIDVQQGFDDVAHWGGERNNAGAEAALLRLLTAWRQEGLLVFHVQHASTSPESPLHPERAGFALQPGFAPQSGETLVVKEVNSAFMGTTLEAQLRRAGIGRLVVGGLTTDHCVSTTVRMAGNLGFDTFVLQDATATFAKRGPGGEVHAAALVHDISLASLREFAHITGSEQVMKALSRARALCQAQSDALALLREVEAASILAPGRKESEMSRDIWDLARRQTPAISKFWHKRIVRVDENTVETYGANPADRLLASDGIAFVDLGPVMGDFEADVGRTYVWGDADTEKQRLVADLEPLFREGQALYRARPHMTGRQFYQQIVAACQARGWQYGNAHCGHLVGEFPHERNLSERRVNYICDENTVSMSAPADNGELRHWILEIHLVHPKARFGAFYEQLLVD